MEKLLNQLLKEKSTPENEDGSSENVIEEEDNDDLQLLNSLILVVCNQGLAEFVTFLGPFLTSENPIPRVRATAILCEVLRKLPDDLTQISEVQVKTFLEFFLTRYETDGESVLACLKGISFLLKRKTTQSEKYQKFLFEKNEFAQHILTCILSTHAVTDLSQTLRSLVFEITLTLLSNYSLYISQTPSIPWLSSLFQSAMTGEKDPRCLLVCLAILKILLKSENLGGENFVEDAFEATSVYFPITFQPPPDDPFGITHEELVDALNSVFCANPAMVNCVLPMAFERIKMTSTEAGPARIEALRLISCCANEFDVISIAPFLSELRDSLVGLILSPDEDELAVEALNALKSIVRLIAPRAQVNPQDNIWQEFTIVILRRCGMALEASLDSMAANGAARILVAISDSCSIGFVTTLKGVVPLLENFFRNKISSSEILKIITAIELIRNLSKCINPKIGHLPGEGPMDKYCSRLFQLTDNQLKETLSNPEWIKSVDESRLVTSICLTIKDLICRTTVVEPEIIESFQNETLNLLLDKVWLFVIRNPLRSSRKDVYGASLICLRDLDLKFKDLQLLSTLIIPKILEEIKTSGSELVGENKEWVDMKEKLTLLLSCLPLLCTGEDEKISSLIIDFLLSLDDGNSQKQYSSTLKFPILAKIAKTIPKIETLEKSFRLADENNSLLSDWLVSSESSYELLSILCERCSPEMNEKLLKLALNHFHETDEIHVGTEACLLTMRRDYPYVLDIILEHLQKRIASNSLDNSFLKILACSINKAPSSKEFEQKINTLFSFVDLFSSQQQCARVFGVVFKALTLRSSVQLSDKIGKFLQTLLHVEDPAVSLEAGKAFGNLIANANDDGLNVPFVRSQGVARQRAFEKWFKILYEDLLTTQKSEEAVLFACTSLAAGAPIIVLKESLKDVVITMIRACKSTNHEETKLAALRILKNSIEDEFELISLHLSTIIPFLVNFTKHGPQRAKLFQDRLDSLTVLESFPRHLPYHKLHPFRSLVSSSLAKGALDDEKRIVRQKGVECRERWALFSITS